jgi:hypothetical protein
MRAVAVRAISVLVIAAITGTSSAGAAAPATASVGSVLAAVPIPFGMFSPGAELRANLSLWTIPPGARANRASTCCPGLVIEYVITGSYAVRPAASARLVRAGGAEETILAGHDATLGPGDALIIRNETAIEAGNAGDQPVRLLTWLAIEVGPGTPEYAGRGLRGWARASVGRSLEEIVTPPSDLVVWLLWAELAPGEAIDLPVATAGFATSPTKDETGAVIYSRIARPSEDRFVNIGRMTVPVYVLAIGPASGQACRLTGSDDGCAALG